LCARLSANAFAQACTSFTLYGKITTTLTTAGLLHEDIFSRNLPIDPDLLTVTQICSLSTETTGSRCALRLRKVLQCLPRQWCVVPPPTHSLFPSSVSPRPLHPGGPPGTGTRGNGRLSMHLRTQVWTRKAAWFGAFDTLSNLMSDPLKIKPSKQKEITFGLPRSQRSPWNAQWACQQPTA